MKDLKVVFMGTPEFAVPVLKEIIQKFTKGSKMMERVFHGFFDESKDGMHETLQNFTTINLVKSKKICYFALNYALVY